MIHASLRLFQSRHPLARIATALIAAAGLVVLFAVGAALLAVIIVGGVAFAIARAVRSGPRPAARPARPASAPGVIEGEFTVVDEVHGPRATRS